VKIGMVAPHYSYLDRGAEHFVQEVSKRLKNRGHSIDFITIPKDSVRIDKGIGGKWRDICDKTQASGFFRKFIGIEPDIAHFNYFLNKSNLVTDNYDVLWNNGEMFGAMLCYKMRKRYGTPFMSTFHGNESMMMILESLMKPDLFVVLTHRYEAFLVKMGIKANIKCVPNGVDLDYFNPKKKENINFNIPRPWYISTSAHEPNKHVDEAIDYVAEHDGSLIITSKGSQTSELKRMCKEKLKNKHKFLGLVESERIPVLLASSDYYITCSTSEGHSLAILEALASGLKVIAPNADENIKWTIGSNDRKQAENFSWEKTVDRYECIMKDVKE